MSEKNLQDVVETVQDKVEDKASELKDKVEDVVSDTKDTVTDATDDAQEKVKDLATTAGAKAEDVMDAIEKSDDGVDEKAETLCRWAAGRAGVIVVAPLLGTVALMANEFYLINKLAKLYKKPLKERAILGFLGAFGGTLAGNVLATLIPVSLLQVPIAVGVTYAVGKAAQAWIKDGAPDDMDKYVEVFKEWKDKAKTEIKVLANDPLKNIPLGDETKDYLLESGSRLSDALEDAKDKMMEALAAGKENFLDTKEVLGERAAIGAEKIKEKASNSNVLSDVVGKLSGLVEATKAKVANNEGSKEDLSKLEKLINEAKELAEEFKDTAADKLDDLKDKADDLKDKAGDLVDDAKEKASELKEKAEEKLK